MPMSTPCRKFFSVVGMNYAPHNRAMNMKSLGARIKSRREEVRMTQEELAACVGVTYQAVYAWERGSIPRPKKLDKIAACLKTTVDELLGVPPNLRSEKPTQIDAVQGSTQDYLYPDGASVRIMELQGRVPLVSWTLAGNWKRAQKTFHPGDAEKYIYVTVDVGDMAFAVRVSGDSMEPKIPAGSIVVIDPSQEPLEGSIVLANVEGKAVLKQLVYAGQEAFLKPLNPVYPLSPLSGAEIVGVAVQVTLDLL